MELYVVMLSKIKQFQDAMSFQIIAVLPATSKLTIETLEQGVKYVQS